MDITRWWQVLINIVRLLILLLTFSQTGLVGGVILLMSAITEDLKNILNHTKIPVVLIGGGKQEHGFDTVAIDNYQGAFNATEYLIKKKGLQ